MKFRKYSLENVCNIQIGKTPNPIHPNRRKDRITQSPIPKQFAGVGESVWQKIKYQDRLDGVLQWMKDKGAVPNGWGKLIV